MSFSVRCTALMCQGTTGVLHGASVELYSATVELYGATVELYGATVELYGATVKLYGATVELYGAGATPLVARNPRLRRIVSSYWTVVPRTRLVRTDRARAGARDARLERR